MTPEKFEDEKNYQSSRQIAENLRSKGLLTEEEFGEIDTILLQKYRPSLGTLFSENACYAAPLE